MAQTLWTPRIAPRLCHGCGVCINGCEVGALGWDDDGRAALAHPERCVYCATCETNCPNGAIELPYLICFSEKDEP